MYHADVISALRSMKSRPHRACCRCTILLVSESERRTDDAKAAFNRAWDLIETTDRTPEQIREMIMTAMASRYLWSIAQEPADESTLVIGDWQIAHVLSLIGSGELALLFAEAAFQRVRSNGWTDWRQASVEEGLSRAHAILGNKEEQERHADACRRLLPTLDDEDRSVIEAQLMSI